ncbi:serine palmitoyltransferase small subunit A-like isoform X1 [Anopheles stephensi]|uniref:serine palmitoyltransferase small subunit A-like isoform X1 n=1 Tax=Anopheles stephensi TaxID=30069 RepID=UPI001658BF2D|nr:serine palmitoyltransferase small subunit A-like isoform X1 [Anopheles stephensi]
MDKTSTGSWKEKLQKRWDIFYLKWQIYSMTYFLEPWEKCLVNAFIFAILGLLIFSSYTFLPGYTRKLVNAFLPAHSALSDLDLDHQRSMEFNIH